VTDELVDVLLTPLLGPGAADVVFDTLSYSAGPLPEQLLQDPRLSDIPVWVCYGLEDPWTSAQRVEALLSFPPVERVVPLAGVGHCPHDEAPERVNPLIIDFMRRVAGERKELAGTAAAGGADQQAS
jgi:pimeloyl-ACP methyl ester carboxylesterase